MEEDGGDSGMGEPDTGLDAEVDSSAIEVVDSGVDAHVEEDAGSDSGLTDQDAGPVDSGSLTKPAITSVKVDTVSWNPVRTLGQLDVKA